MFTGKEGRFGIASRIGNFVSETPEVPLLLLLVAFYIFVANYFAWGSTFSGGLTNFSGGSDPYWNYYMIQYILSHKHMLSFTTVINYPLGTWNPRNGTFHWMIVFVAYLVSPFTNVYNAAAFGLLEIDAVFGALLIIPVYLITNEVFGKKSAMLAAILYALMPSNFSSGILSDARTEHTPILLFALFTIYFFIRTMHFIGKERIVPSLISLRSYPRSISTFIRNNRLATIYAFLSAGTLGSLMVAWQGFAYIEAIIAIYVMVQLLLNLVTRRPTGYMTFVSTILFGFSLFMGYYYYVSLHELSPWWTSAFYIAVIAIGFSVIVNLIGNRPWVITLPLIVILSIAGLYVLNIVDPSAVSAILAGDGYFIKTRVYQTIAEASSPALGTYISGFGMVQFLLGMAGVVYTIYLFLKKKNDLLLMFVVFALVSIYMSFSAARFNITAGPAYAAMGGAALAFFAKLVKMSDIKRRTPTESSGIRKAVRGNISWGRAIFTAMVVLGVITSGFGVVNAAVPANSALGVNQQIYSSLPSFIKPLVNYSSSNDQFVGTYSFYITNNSQAEPMAFNWLSTQDTNLPVEQRPAFVSWWDYGFQELVQGQHPAVADDFQQGYEIGGQTLLAQNQSQILSLWIGRVLQGDFKNNGNNLSAGSASLLEKYLGSNETAFLEGVLANAGQYSYLIAQHPDIYGKYISQLSGQNGLFILFTGSLSSQYSLSTLVDLYQALETQTGYNIQYIYMDQGLLPQSGLNPGIFYAPTYLTDHPSYSYQGEIVPYQYYQIYATLANGTQYTLNNTPLSSQVSNYNIVYTPAFYNTTIYRTEVGYPPSALGSTNGIPGLTVNTSSQVMPDWNMSNFELVYAGVPYNPYTDYQNHSTAWKIIPISTAYTYKNEKKGTVILLPSLASVIAGWDTVTAYYPGAVIHGQVKLADGTPAAGVYLTIFDQYGIPHQVVKTDSNGYYNLTGLPGNDSVFLTTGVLNQQYLIGTNLLGSFQVNITKQQAERLVPANSIGGVAGYRVTKDYIVSSGGLKGSVSLQTVGQNSGTTYAPVLNGTLTFKNIDSRATYTVPVNSGQYSLPAAVPGTYNVSLSTPDGLLTNFTEENVTTSSSSVSIQAPMDTVFATVSTGITVLSGIQVTANSSTYSTSAVTNATGVAILGVAPGNYSIVVNGTGFTSWRQYVNFSQWNLNTSVSLSPVPLVNVTGIVSGAVSSTVSLMRNGVYSDNYTVQTSDGRFSMTVPAGYYTIYARSGSLVAASSQELTVDTKLTLVLSQGYYVNVSAFSKSSTLQNGFFEAMSASGLLLKSSTVSSNYYNFLIPTGVYGFAASFTSTGLSLSGFKSYQILGNLSFSILTTSQQNLTVTITSSVSSTSGSLLDLSDGVVVEKQSGIPVFYLPLSGSEFVSLVHPLGNLTPYTINIVGPSFGNASGTVLGDAQSVSIYISPVLSSFSFSLKSVESILMSGTLTLSGRAIYNLVIDNNTINGNVLPGVYHLSVSSTSGTVNLSNQILVVPFGNSYSNYAQYVQYFSIKSTAPYIKVFYSNGTEANSDMLVPGSYTAYSYSNAGSNVSVVNVAGSVNLTPGLLPSVHLNLTNSGGLSGGTYTIRSGSAVLSTTVNSMFLPYGNYSVSYLQNYTVSGIDYSASGYTTVSLYKYSTVNVPLNINTVKTGVTGMVTYDGSAVPFAQVSILDSNGVAILNTTADKTGNYSVQLSGGDYTVFSYFKAYSAAGISSIYVPAFSNVVTQNINLTNAYTVYVSESKEGVLLADNVTITGGSAKILFNTTQQSILLPAGTYTFGGTAKYVQQNFTGGSLDVYWNNSVTTAVSRTTYVNIILNRVTVYGFESGMLSNVSSVLQGSNLTDQVFFVKNTGNTYVNLTFSSGLEDMNVTVNKSKVQLAPGQNMTLSANLTLPKKMSAGQNLMPVIATYGSSNYTVNIKVNITASSSFSEHLNPAINFIEGNSFVVPVNFTNTGNTKLLLNVSIDTSEANNYGWNANISSTNVNHTQISIDAFQSQIVYLNITPYGTNYFSSGTIHMNVTSGTGNASSFAIPVSLPSLVKVTSTTGGTHITQFSGSPYLTLIIGIVLIVVAVVGGLVGASYRGRKNR